MSDQTPETTETEDQERHYEVSILAHPYARSPLEAYLMTVDSLIREGTDQFHPLITDVVTGERWLLTNDGQLVSGEQMTAALQQLKAQIEEAEQTDDGAPDRG